MKDLLLTDSTLWGRLLGEADSQVAKWGIQDRSPWEWMTYLTEEIGELAKAISDHEYSRGGQADQVAKEAIQSAVLCLKLAEMYLNIEAARGSGGV